MRKFALLGLVAVACSGCGRGWLPMFRGASCRSGCGLAAPAMPASYDARCLGCGTAAAGYGSFDGDIGGGEGYFGGDVLSGGDYYNGAVIGSGLGNGGGETIVNPSGMTPLPRP